MGRRYLLLRRFSVTVGSFRRIVSRDERATPWRRSCAVLVNLAFSFDRRLSGFCQRTGGNCRLNCAGVTSEGMHAPLSSSADRLARGRFSDWPLALKSILGFWFFYALTIVARAFLGSDPMTDAQQQAVHHRRGNRRHRTGLRRHRPARRQGQRPQAGDRRRTCVLCRRLGHGRSPDRRRRHDAGIEGRASASRRAKASSSSSKATPSASSARPTSRWC